MHKSSHKMKAALRSVIPQAVLDPIRIRREKKQARRVFLDNLKPRDVFVVGHPKSGNTWLAYMMAVLLHEDVDEQINISNIGSFVPTIHARDSAIAEFNGLTEPRLFRNEGPVFPELYPKTVYIVRDPRSVLLSYYHHCVHDTGEYDWRLEDFVDEMLSKGCISRLEPFQIRWDRQVAFWTRRAKQHPVLVVRYEDLKKDRRRVLQNLIKFLGIERSEDSLTMAAERGDFDSMRNEEKTHGAESYAGEKGAKGFFVRKGKTDSWKEEMSTAVTRKIEAAYGVQMKQLGYMD